MKAYSIKRAALCVALGACLGVVLPGIAMAQNVSGAVAGRATAGDQVTVVSSSTGLTRTVTVGADGSYRLGQLPVGDYQLQLSRDGQKLGDQVSVSVAVGGTTTVNLGSGAFALQCSQSGAVGLTHPASGTSFTITTGATLAGGESCAFTIDASKEFDAGGASPAQNTVANFTVASSGGTGYYSRVNTSSASQLRCSLHETIKGHTAYFGIDCYPVLFIDTHIGVTNTLWQFGKFG